MDCVSDDRRECYRYPLELKLRYRVMQGLRTVLRGTGYTTDLSRKAIRFVVSRALAPNSRVELVLDWPVQFGDMYPMELYISGIIQRSGEGQAVALMTSWQFRIAAGARSVETARAQGWASRGRVREEVPMPATAVM